MNYKVKLEIFEGPLDLLLYLIKKNEVDIYNIPIAEVTNQYLEYLNLFKLMDLDIAGDFLVMASTLMHIKSKMLLPQEEQDEEIEEEEDPRQELVNKLLEYRKFKQVTNRLKRLESEQLKIFTRKTSFDIKRDIPVHFEASLFDLIDVFKKVMKNVPKELFNEVIKDEVTVEEKTHELLHMLTRESKLYFTKLFKNAKSKLEIIAIFLSILELIRLKEILVYQQKDFGEIVIIRNEKHRLSEVT